MALSTVHPIAVIDFRRHSMMLNWYPADGSWTPCDVAPPLLHGVAWIRPEKPNICVYAHDNALLLQIGAVQYLLLDESPQVAASAIVCKLVLTTFGFRKRFTVESAAGNVLFTYAYWASQGDGFFRWLTERAADAGWRRASSNAWSGGVDAALLRAG